MSLMDYEHEVLFLSKRYQLQDKVPKGQHRECDAKSRTERTWKINGV